MKKLTITTIFLVGFIFGGCVSSNSNLSKSDIKKYDSSMTSKQVEEIMGWEYCKEPN